MAWVAVTVVARWPKRGNQVGSSIQCSRLGVKAMAARVCPWCFKVLNRVSS